MRSDRGMGSTAREHLRGGCRGHSDNSPGAVPAGPDGAFLPAVCPLRAAHAERDVQDRRQPPRGGGARGAAVALPEPPVPQQAPLPEDRRARGGRGGRAALQRALPGHRCHRPHGPATGAEGRPQIPPGAGAAFPAWHMLGRQAGAAKRREQLPAWLRGHSRAPGSIPGTGEGGTARPTGGAEILSKRSGSVVSRRFAELCSPLRLLRAGICSPALVEGLAGVQIPGL